MENCWGIDTVSDENYAKLTTFTFFCVWTVFRKQFEHIDELMEEVEGVAGTNRFSNYQRYENLDIQKMLSIIKFVMPKKKNRNN